NSSTDLDVVALQEMHNQFREHIDTGLKHLAENSGKNGLPPAPSAGARMVAEGQAQPDNAATVEEALMRQQADANQAEQEVQHAAEFERGARSLFHPQRRRPARPVRAHWGRRGSRRRENPSDSGRSETPGSGTADRGLS